MDLRLRVAEILLAMLPMALVRSDLRSPNWACSYIPSGVVAGRARSSDGALRADTEEAAFVDVRDST